MSHEAAVRAERKVLEQKLLAGLQSPVSQMKAEDWAALRQLLLARSPELASEPPEPPAEP